MIVAAVLNAAMAFVKFFVGLSSNCISIVADGYNNAADCIGNVMGAVAKRFARRAPDARYPNGYGRVETLITFVIVTITMAVGAYFVYTSVERLFFRLPMSFLVINCVLIAVSAVVKLAMFVVYRRLNKKAPSPILRANELDSIQDAVITICTLLAYGLGNLIRLPIDSLIGISIGVYVMASTFGLWRADTRSLLGRDDVELRDAIAMRIRAAGFSVDDDPTAQREGLHIFSYGNRHIAYCGIASKDDERIAALAKEIEDELQVEMHLYSTTSDVAHSDETILQHNQTQGDSENE